MSTAVSLLTHCRLLVFVLHVLWYDNSCSIVDIHTHIPQPCPNCRAGVRLSHLWEALQFCSAITRHCLEIRVTLVPNLYSYASLRPSSQRTPYRARACPWEYHIFRNSAVLYTQRILWEGSFFQGFSPFEVFLWNNKVRHVFISFIKVHLGKLIIVEILSCN